MDIERNESLYQNRQKLPQKQRGITIVEYAVGGALIASAVVAAFGALGNQIALVLNNIVIGIG